MELLRTLRTGDSPTDVMHQIFTIFKGKDVSIYFYETFLLIPRRSSLSGKWLWGKAYSYMVFPNSGIRYDIMSFHYVSVKEHTLNLLKWA